MRHAFVVVLVGAAISAAQPAHASSILYSNMNVTGAMATGSRPSSAQGIEIETADDFVVGTTANVTEIKFIGLITGGATLDLSQTNLELYRVYPLDSNTSRTPGVPTRTNSPSDVAFDSRSSADFASVHTTVLDANFSAANSVLNNILVNNTLSTGGEGTVRGEEVLFDIVLTTPWALAANHYFFVPQVLTGPGGNFYWLSAERPISSTGSNTPFVPDLQAWIRNSTLDPDWLRVGTDIIGGNPAPTFNMAFELDEGTSATAVPEPTSLLLLGTGIGVAWRRRRRPSKHYPA